MVSTVSSHNTMVATPVVGAYTYLALLPTYTRSYCSRNSRCPCSGNRRGGGNTIGIYLVVVVVVGVVVSIQGPSSTSMLCFLRFNSSQSFAYHTLEHLLHLISNTRSRYFLFLCPWINELYSPLKFCFF